MPRMRDANRQRPRVGAITAVLAIALPGIALTVTAQDTIACPDFDNGVTAGGCTDWGWGDDETIRSLAGGYLDGIYFRSDPFCNRVMDEAESWLGGFTTAVAGVLERDGDSLDAASIFWSNGEWDSAYIRDWVRDSTFSINQRSEWLGDVALHESAHKACYEGDYGGTPCNPQIEDEVSAAVRDCRSQD